MDGVPPLHQAGQIVIFLHHLHHDQAGQIVYSLAMIILPMVPLLILIGQLGNSLSVYQAAEQDLVVWVEISTNNIDIILLHIWFWVESIFLAFSSQDYIDLLTLSNMQINKHWVLLIFLRKASPRGVGRPWYHQTGSAAPSKPIFTQFSVLLRKKILSSRLIASVGVCPLWI